MNKSLKITLISLAIIIGIPVLLFTGYVFLMADFFSGPSERECVKMVEHFMGCKLGRHYEILDYDVDYSHPDRILSFSVKIPSERFQKVVDFCEKEVEAKDVKPYMTEEEKYTHIETFSRDERGFKKDYEVLRGDLRVHYQVLHVLLDEGLITFDRMNY